MATIYNLAGFPPPPMEGRILLVWLCCLTGWGRGDSPPALPGGDARAYFWNQEGVHGHTFSFFTGVLSPKEA